MQVGEDQGHLEAAPDVRSCDLRDQVAGHPEVDGERREEEKMAAPTHASSVQEPATTDDRAEAPSPLDGLSLAELEETGGKLHRRIAVALRLLGEQRANRADGEGHAPRWRVAALCVALELATATLGFVDAATDAPVERIDRRPATVAAAMYSAPTIAALLSRLQQDRRMLASLSRHLEGRLDERSLTAWGEAPLRHMIGEVLVHESARCAQALERLAARTEA